MSQVRALRKRGLGMIDKTVRALTQVFGNTWKESS